MVRSIYIYIKGVICKATYSFTIRGSGMLDSYTAEL